MSFVKVCRKKPDLHYLFGLRSVVCSVFNVNIEIKGCYNRRHRRGANSTLGSGQGLKAKSRRGSQDSDDVDDDSLAAELLVSTVKNLRSLCEIMLDGIRYRITKLDKSNLVLNFLNENLVKCLFCKYLSQI